MSGIRPLLAVGLLLLATALVPVATGGWTAVPTPWWLAVAVGAVVAWALRRPGAPDWRRDLPVAAVLGAFAAAAHLAPGMVVGHDSPDHSWGAWAYLQAWHAGDWLPLWLHHLGLGQPMPLFYGPLPFWAMAPFALVGGGPSLMISGSLVLAAAVASCTAWGAVASWTNDRRAALVAALAMAFAPYRLMDANYRLALGETWALGLFPLGILAFERLLAEGSRRRFAFAAVTVALVALAHPLSLVLLAITLAGLAAVRLPGERARGSVGRARALGRSALAGVTGLALAGFFVVPLAVHLRFLELTWSVEEAGERAYAAGGLRPLQLVARYLWDRLDSGMPFYFGLVLGGALACAVLGGRRLAPRGSPQTALALLACLSLALALSPLARVASQVPGLAILQFPWRFLGPASVLAALVAGCLVASAGFHPRIRPGGLATGLALALLVDGFPYTGAAYHLEPWRGLLLASQWRRGEAAGFEIPRPWPLRVRGSFFPPNDCCADLGFAQQIYHEYFTAAASESSRRLEFSSVALEGRLGRIAPWLQPIGALPYARRYLPGGEAPTALAFARGGGRIEVELPDLRGGRVEVAEQYFPGWQVEVGGRWREVAPSAEGLLTAPAPERDRRVRFRFQRWRWDRALGWALTLATAVLLALRARPRSRGPRRSRSLARRHGAETVVTTR